MLRHWRAHPTRDHVELKGALSILNYLSKYHLTLVYLHVHRTTVVSSYWICVILLQLHSEDRRPEAEIRYTEIEKECVGVLKV